MYQIYHHSAGKFCRPAVPKAVDFAADIYGFAGRLVKGNGKAALQGGVMI